jgi:hypothetical protein
MPREEYRAKAMVKGTSAKQTTSRFGITVRFIGGLTDGQKNAFKLAADRWTKVIVGDLPAVTIDGEVIDDILIIAEGVSIDGVGGILGQAGPTHLRPSTATRGAYLPARGQMQFDSSDLSQMESSGTLNDVIAHEMGHVLGFGTIWNYKKLLKGARTSNPTFVGAGAMAEYTKLRGATDRTIAVPVENTGGAGTRDSHWRETSFRNELMSGFIAAAGNPLSRVTVASMKDLGYTVDLDAAEPYGLPNLAELAERGLLVSHAVAPHEHGVVLPLIPSVLPPESLK